MQKERERGSPAHCARLAPRNDRRTWWGSAGSEAARQQHKSHAPGAMAAAEEGWEAAAAQLEDLRINGGAPGADGAPQQEG